MLTFINILHHSNNSFFFFFNDTATTEIYTLSLHDALPISSRKATIDTRNTHPFPGRLLSRSRQLGSSRKHQVRKQDRKSTRLNSSHSQISYAVFCLKKKNI